MSTNDVIEWIRSLIDINWSDEDIADELDSSSTFVKLGGVIEKADLIGVIRELLENHDPSYMV